MKIVPTILTAAVFLSGCATGVSYERTEVDLAGTLSLCANPPLTQDEIARQLKVMGWTPQQDPASIHEILLWEAFGYEYVLNPLHYVQDDNLTPGEKLGRMYEGAVYRAGLFQNRYNMLANQASHESGRHKLTILADDEVRAYCVVSGPKSLDELLAIWWKDYSPDSTQGNSANAIGAQATRYELGNLQFIKLGFDARKVKVNYAENAASYTLLDELFEVSVFDNMPEVLAVVFSMSRSDEIENKEKIENSNEGDIQAIDQTAEKIESTNSSIDEMHMVGIYEPYSDETLKRKDVSVRVDRPGKTVALVLGSNDPAHWRISASNGTTVERVVISGSEPQLSEAYSNDEVVLAERLYSQTTYKAKGFQFQEFHSAAAEKIGISNADSFHGSYAAPAGGFSISLAPGVSTKEDEKKELEKNARNRSTISSQMQDAIAEEAGNTGMRWEFDDDGFVGIDENGTVMEFRTPLDLPRISWPKSAVYDPDNQRLYGVTLGGEGFLYEYDIVQNQWWVGSMNEVDVGGLIFDNQTGNLITTPGDLGFHEYAFLILDRRANVISRVNIPTSNYPGLEDTYDPENDPSPVLEPLIIEGEKLLVQTKHESTGMINNQERLYYLVDLGDQSVELVR